MSAAVRLDAEGVIERLEDAGKTLLRLPNAGCLPAGMRAAWPEVAHAAMEAYGYGQVRTRPGPPSASDITRMDEAYCWVSTIPLHQKSFRRIVLLRSLVSPITDRHAWSFRRIGDEFGWSDTAVRNWHAAGIDLIVRHLNGLSNANAA